LPAEGAIDTENADATVERVLFGRKGVSIENWSDNIIVAELQDDPAFTDDLTGLTDQLDANKDVDVVLSFAGVNHLNSSNIAKLLILRKRIISNKRRLVLCAINTGVWGLFLVTGLDKVFEFTDNVSHALASVQITIE
jgi:anti-anti-sigma factor